MLFNVYYNEDYFPLIKEVKYIVNESTQEKLTLTEFLNNISTYDEVNYILNLPVFFSFLEKEMKAQGYECKHTKTAKFSRYTSALKPNTYVADIYARSDVKGTKFLNKVRIGTSNGQKHFINFNAYTKYVDINTPFPQEEIELADYLSSIGCKESTPAGAMRREYGINKLQTELIREDFTLAMRSTTIAPAIIEAYDLGYFKEAWSYDVNSMYLAMLKSVKYMPDTFRAKRVDQPQLVPPNHFGWHQKSSTKWEVVFEGEIIWPDDWLVPPMKTNPYIDMIDHMFEDKQAAKQLGGCAYRFYKQKANSFIGSFAQKNRRCVHFTNWEDTEGRRDPLRESGIPHYDIFSIVTALARRYIESFMEQAREHGCKVLQVNTDGFIVDKPLPESMLGEELGALRLDKHLTNLYIFGPNRYVADGIQSISGLPEGMYKPGQTIYHYNKIQWTPLDGCFKLIDTKIDLMDELKMNFVELEDVINYE